ncbi:glutathione S-transferase family protein [Pseudothioclava nitratireducens]|uniref:glutathione S-transferase family protein n=1 Tax=Pseudothioclava nitratireducens TaxID=1928646 RepID=UPI0023DCE244|nr:glutathione S-transferase family protein [Defluviimonas nitratireducens]MDF1619783.1 glutathione S-transferase family protein [Defluviimonas nitratireducens]
MKLYSMPSSGNSYKVRLLLALLGRDCEMIDVEYLTAALDEAKATGALPFGKAPVLHLDDGRVLAESNAILNWLGEGTEFLPGDAFTRAQMLSWMFWEQNQHEGVIAVRAALRNYPHRAAQATPERMAELLTRGNELMQMMEDHLAKNDWLAGDRISLADICLYAYTHTAESRVGYDLAPFPALRAWLARIAALPGYIGLED